MQKISFKFFCLKTKKFHWGTLRCFRKFRVSKNFMHTKGISVFSVEFFCLTVLEKFVGEPFCVSKNFWSGKKLWIRGGGGAVTVFGRNFMSNSTETFVGEHFSVSLISVIEKCYAQAGYITIFCRKFVVSQYRKTS